MLQSTARRCNVCYKVLGGIFSCNGGKLETSEGCICLFVVSYVLESKQSVTNTSFVAQYITGCRTVVGKYIHFSIDLQPVIYWATNHCKLESIARPVTVA